MNETKVLHEMIEKILRPSLTCLLAVAFRKKIISMWIKMKERSFVKKMAESYALRRKFVERTAMTVTVSVLIELNCQRESEIKEKERET